MIGLFIDVASLAIVLALVLWGVWYAVKYFWPSAETSPAGQIIGKLTDTTQAYTIYGLLESMKLDNKVKEDANALGAIAYLQSVALRGVAKDWTSETTEDVINRLEEKLDEDDTNTNAESVTWEPKK